MFKTGITKLQAPYLFFIILYAFGPIAFPNPFLKSVIFVLVIFTFIMLFMSLGVSSALNTTKAPKNYDHQIIKYFKYASLPILLSSSYYVYWLYSKGTSIDVVLTSTGEVREMTAGSDFGKQVAGLLAYQSYGYIPILVTKWRRYFPFYVNVIMTAAIGLMALAVVLQAGRSFFLVAGSIAYATYLITSNVSGTSTNSENASVVRRLLIYLFACFAAISTISIIYLIGVQRVSSVEISNTVLYAEYRYFNEFFKSLPSNIAYFMTAVFHYAAGPWSNFNIAIAVENGIFRWSAGPLEAIIVRFSEGGGADVSVARLDNFRRYLSLGGEPTGWRTGFGNVLDWYGPIGVIVFACFISFIASRSLVAARLFETLTSLLRATWVVAFFIMCLFYFPSDTVFWVNLTHLFVVIPILAMIFRSKRTRP